MRTRFKIWSSACAFLLYAAIGSVGPAVAASVLPVLKVAPAEHNSAALHTDILAATLAGKRIVAVGDHGVVLLSDDDGRTFRQAGHVPVSSTLSAVTFVDDRTGWAVGHWGAIIKTTDGGENWTAQRSDLSVDQPLFSAYFRTAEEGWAVGLWSLMLHTTDGGATWSTVVAEKSVGKIARNFYSIFADSKGLLFVACEQGRVMRSSDSGHSWTSVDTGYAGSFWTGAALPDGTLLLGGLRGTIYRSLDDGLTWALSKTPYKSSVTAIAEATDKGVVAIALDGVLMTSRDDGVSFSGHQRQDRTSLTAQVKASDGHMVLFSENGPAESSPDSIAQTATDTKSR